MFAPYTFGRNDLPELLIRRYYPERTGRESIIIRDWLKQHGHEFDRIAFSVRIGEGLAPNPDHEPGIQAMTERVTKKRIDVLTWTGDQAGIVECKERVTAAVLGQLLAYRQLYLEENPGAKEPTLTVIGRTCTQDDLRVLLNHGITVYLYDPT